jgi:hypothetical protein
MEKTEKEEINISNLPESVRREFYDYYEFLMRKYGRIERKKRKPSRRMVLLERKQAFFESVRTNSFHLPPEYTFDRVEAHER